MKKIEYKGKDPDIKLLVDSIQQDFREIFLKNMQESSAAPTENLKAGMTYYDSGENKFKILISTDPVTWKTLAYE